MKRNMRFQPEDETQMEELQQLLFSQGYSWEPPESTTVKHIDAKYLYAYASGKLTFGTSLGKFVGHNNEHVDPKQYLMQHTGQASTPNAVDAYDKAMQIIE